MGWFKHNGNASFDSRMVALFESLGYFGIGVYWSMVERIECWGRGSFPRVKLMEEMAGRKADRHKLGRVIDEFDLFVTDENGYVSLNNGKSNLQPTPRPTPEPTLTPSPQPTDENDTQVGGCEEPQRACVSNIEEDKNKNTVTSPSSFLDSYAEDMQRPSGWREVVCMQSGYGELLDKHWKEAVEQWRLHVIAFSTQNELSSLSRAQYYFNCFIKPHSKTGSALKARLECLEAQACAPPPSTETLPPGAPPKPSEKAIWNPAKEEWCEFY